MRKVTALLAMLVVVTGFALPAAAAFDPGQIAYPVDGPNRLTDSFGDCRGANCERSHEGVDIMADKGVPVLAVADGVVSRISPVCCTVWIDNGGGWESRYLHLNNDTRNPDGSYSDDGKGWGIASGVVVGATVTRGQLIGWVGDSGNAEGTAPHVQVELRTNGQPIDPYPYLLKAQSNWVGYFSDDENSVHQNNIDKIYVAKITLGCNPPLNTMFCPQRNITRGEMAAFIARALHLTEMSENLAYDDVDGHLFEIAIDKIQVAGIGFGCDADSFCPDRPLERDEMAELLVRAFDYQNAAGTDFFTDDEGNPFEESINKLANAGITVGCNPPAYDQYCPDRNLSRGEMATFFVRSLGL